MVNTNPFCEKRVFGYDRLIGGERCSNRAKAEYGGKWLCGLHSPEAVAKREAKKEENYQEHVRQSNRRAEKHNYRAACVNAFHDPNRSIATEQISKGLFWRMHDMLEDAGETMEMLANRLGAPTESANPKADAEGYGSYGMLQDIRALLASLQVEEPADG